MQARCLLCRQRPRLAHRPYCSFRCQTIVPHALFDFDVTRALHGGRDNTRAVTLDEAGRHPDIDALLIRGAQQLLAGENKKRTYLAYHTPPSVSANVVWALDDAHPSVALWRGGRGNSVPPLRALSERLVQPPALARVFATESDEVFRLTTQHGGGGGDDEWIARLPRLDAAHAVYALMGLADYNVVFVPTQARFVGRSDWSTYVPGAPREDDPDDAPRWRAYAHDLGRALAQLHYVWLCDGRGLAIVLAAPVGTGGAPLLHVMVDTRLAGHVPPAPDHTNDLDLVQCLAESLARMAYVPVRNDVDRTAPVALAAAFADGYRDEASTYGRAALALAVLDAVTLLV